ncbi:MULTISPECIES: site-specific integrase [unclassified Agrobacterium]|uniref:site-specific integrase n=1 Tax=unclassified Agrobacterium TaxID=2632611 RepID=UPI000B6254C6|nr:MULTISPECIES: site-specific integrase [unclassified Agrobacterium]SNB61977.1 Site-specific recombinase XerD [Agrobacterium sp. 719_389]
MIWSISDNSHYRGSQQMNLDAGVPDLQSIARDKPTMFSSQVREFIALSYADNTRRAYSGDLRKFVNWGGGLPCRPEILASYIAAHAATHKPTTLCRWASSISRAHIAAGYSDPTKVEPVVSTLKGICRTLSSKANQAHPLLREDLFAALNEMGDSVRDRRDRAILLIGFAGGFRRSELVALDFEDLQSAKRGLLIAIRRSKTDQLGRGRQIAIPFGRTRHCPVGALEDWLKLISETTGPIFRAINRYGHIARSRLSAETVSVIVKERVAAIGHDPSNFSGHSLRAGFATSAAEAGVSSWKIRQQTGHASDAMLARYIRSVELFEGNASGAII